jgi:hypothetical protein
VIDVTDRSVRRREVHQWRAAEIDAVLEGPWVSESISGADAEAIVRVYYYFDVNGAYSDAALIAGEVGNEFQTLPGRWSLRESRLDLGDAGVFLLQQQQRDAGIGESHEMDYRSGCYRNGCYRSG